jgi:hypothetical protein
MFFDENFGHLQDDRMYDYFWRSAIFQPKQGKKQEKSLETKQCYYLFGNILIVAKIIAYGK